MTETTALTTTEQNELASHVTTVKEGQGAFVRVAEALMQIKDKRLWRGTSDTFEGFCQVTFGFSRRQGDRLIASAGVVNRLSADLDPVGPISERVARAISDAPEAEQAEVFKEAVATAPKKNGKPHVTAKHVEQVVAKRKEPEPADTTPSVTDELGTSLPTPEIREAFEQRKQFRLIYACLIQAKKDMRALMNTPAGAYLDEQEIEQRMKDARNLVTTYTMPYAVCPFCQGAAEKCKGCKQTGWMPEKVYESLKGAAGVKA